MRQRAAILLPPLLALALATAAAPAEVDEAWRAEIERSRAEREERLRADDGWLTLAGLFWLEEGDNAFGSDEGNPVVLSAEGVPDVAGLLVLARGRVTVQVRAGVEVLLDGEPVAERVLRDDTAEGGPDVLTVGRLRFHVLRRGDRFGVRVKDPEHPRLKAFTGLDYFPLSADYRLRAEFAPYETPRELEIMTAVGTTTTLLVPGEVRFSLGGRDLSLLPLVSEPEESEFWFIFKDATSGKETYGFRYLYGTLADGRVEIDFNRAYNPPCAFTSYATCPLPPRENWLEIPIESGERIYGKP